ncbi:MAG: 16S rRNA (adenine(1518)-N(6)/adenine(1519)-N(6)) -dimethyltransferase RsmA [Candidatus Methylacidiphilales bacterium]
MTLREIRETLARSGLRPLKQFGQNFLHDENLCRLIATALPPETNRHVIEIGPGLGALTEFLLADGWTVDAIEIDRGLAKVLRERFGHLTSFHLHEADALACLNTLRPVTRLIGNLPYNITTPLLVESLRMRGVDFAAVLLVQKEVAARLAATPSTPDWGALSVLVQTVCQVERLRDLDGHLFHPPPDVASTVIRLTAHAQPVLPLESEAHFYQMVRQGFSQRRKKLKHLLPIDLDARAEELTLTEWHRLYEQLR